MDYIEKGSFFTTLFFKLIATISSAVASSQSITNAGILSFPIVNRVHNAPFQQILMGK